MFIFIPLKFTEQDYYKFTLHFETLLKKYIYFLLFNLKDFAKLFCEKIIIF